ncbi:MAG TPA: cytidine deaminase [Phnomibacter sp.]|nr:cytidine deaminase [Phnomibacter sp.]
MAQHEHKFDYSLFDSIDDLNANDKALLEHARTHADKAYAPYSHFNVAAVAKTVDGHILHGTNQENASYPVGICAERVLLSALSSIHPDSAIETMAISYHNLDGNSGQPASPCGMCRQALVEYEQRMKHPIRLLLSGQQGKVIVLNTAKNLLPFTFTADDLK